MEGKRRKVKKEGGERRRGGKTTLEALPRINICRYKASTSRSELLVVPARRRKDRAPVCVSGAHGGLTAID